METINAIRSSGDHASNRSDSKNAYVTTIFNGDNYLEGVLTLGYSLLETKTSYDVVCMVTPDVSEDAKNKMRMVNIIPIDVPYLRYNSKPLLSKKQRDVYQSWMNVSYTKWNCLNLDYDKILFLDADLVVAQNIDHVFLCNAPATRFTSEIYGDAKLPKKVHPNTIKKLLSTRKGVINGSIVLLHPNKSHYIGLKRMLRQMEPFGFNSLSGSDEQALSYFMSVYDKGPKLSWVNLSKGYLLSWRDNVPSTNTYVYNFTGSDKPWNKDLTNFPDTVVWYAMNKKLKNHLKA